MRDTFERDLEIFKANFSAGLGGTIRKPIPARLGTMLENGVKVIEVPSGERSQTNMYYFHEAGSTSFKGMASMQTGVLSPEQFRYGTPIRIRRDVLTGEWEIIGADLRFLAQFYKDVPKQEIGYYGYENLAPSLLTATYPSSSQAIVIGASYNVGDDWKYTDNLLTVDWTEAPYSANLPSNTNLQRFVMVAFDFSAEELVYEYGDEVASTLTFQQCLATDRENGNHAILPVPTGSDQFRCGYVRLLLNKPTLERFTDIFPMQDYLTKTPSSVSNNSALDNIVVSGGAIVTTSDGDIVMSS